MSHTIKPVSEVFAGANGNRLAADIYGAKGAPVLLLHGGGQTRHAWRKTAQAIARTGRMAYAFDQRGHGDSEWMANGDYAFADFAADAAIVARVLTSRHGRAPIAIGASLGGIASLLAAGLANDQGEPLFAALGLVDITPRVDMAGVEKIQGFMRANSRDGFATIDEAADAVAAYLPHRPRPRSHEGLRKNLRLGPDGRWRWHWDPRFLQGRRPVGTLRAETEAALVEAARRLVIPVLLVRGSASELVQPSHVQEFLKLVPHAEYADVSGARHMVAGDRNDSFSTAILAFLNRLPW